MGMFYYFNYHSCGANYKGVQSLRWNKINRERLDNVLHPVANSTLHQMINKESNDDGNETIKQMNMNRRTQKERIEQTPH